MNPAPGNADADNDFAGGAGAVVQAAQISGGVHVRVTDVPLPPPRQLPPATKGFIDRELHIRQLDSLLDETDLRTSDGRLPVVTISTVSGSAGVGKTALAVHWAHRVRARFPDGDLYINLRGYDAVPPLTPQEALDGFLRALNVPPEKIPTDLPGRTALYRSLTDGRRMLVLLDNASTAEQVRPLLPASPTCMVIITSRDRLSGLAVRDGAIRAVLDVLTDDDSIRLLRETTSPERIDAEPAAAVRLAALCSRLPLALRIVADRAVSDPDMSLADLVTELEEENGRLDALSVPGDELSAVRTVVSWTYRSLDPPVARTFRLLGLHPGADVSFSAVAALTGRPVSEARRHLDSLVGLHLLTRIVGHRYRLHDLLRLYAAERAQADEPPAEAKAGLARMFDWHLVRAYDSYRKILPQGRPIPGLTGVTADGRPPFATLDEALRWSEQERLNVLDVIRLAHDTGHCDVTWKLAAASMAFFERRSYWRAWIDSHLLALDCTRHLADRSAEGFMLLLLGDAWWDRSEIDEALRYYSEARDAAQQVGDSWTAGYALRGCCLAYEDSGRFDEAIACAEGALEIFRDAGEDRGIGLSLMSLGNGHRNMLRYAEAIASYEQAMEIFRTLGNRWSEALVELQLGRTLTDVPEPVAALDHLARARELFAAAGDPRHEGITLVYVGDAHAADGDRTAARQAWSAALTTLIGLDAPLVAEVRRRLEPIEEGHEY
ncbi:ATP-binding protein [Micromonospora sp. LOL_027]|uniref:ATP-binding protein n=1 Tax=Micromonospora sp. LOL_027 TaxID=3345419 RepID=UPI003A87D08A